MEHQEHQHRPPPPPRNEINHIRHRKLEEKELKKKEKVRIKEGRGQEKSFVENVFSSIFGREDIDEDEEQDGERKLKWDPFVYSELPSLA